MTALPTLTLCALSRGGAGGNKDASLDSHRAWGKAAWEVGRGMFEQVQCLAPNCMGAAPG